MLKQDLLNYFLKEWSSPGNAEFAKQYGMKERPEPFDPASIGTYVKYVQLDTDLTQVNQLLKYGLENYIVYDDEVIRKDNIVRFNKS